MVPLSSPELSVAIVSHNHAAYLPACLDSLAPEQHACQLEVFVVDNASTDRTCPLVREAYPWVHLIENDIPLGFAANNNRVIRRSRGNYVLLLNPDTVVPPGMLAPFIQYMEAHPQVGIGGPQLRFPDGRVQPSCRRFPTLGSVLARRTPLRSWLGQSALNQRHLMVDFDHGTECAVDWMLGACLMVRRKFLSRVGLMDEGYFLYVEDIDWAYRAWQQGWEVRYYPGVHIVHHHLAVSDRKLWSVYSWLHLQSMWRYYRKYLVPRWLRLDFQPELLPLPDG